MSRKISRRQFIKSMAAGAAGIGAFGFAAPFSLKASAEGEAVYTPGTYTASAKGLESDVTVTMTFSETEIVDVVVDVSGETEGIGAAIGDTVVQQILSGQTSDIDGVSGASVTSTAVRTAARDCIYQAKGIADEFAAAAEEISWRTAPAPIDEKLITETYNADIGVIGLGHAGLAVFRAAAEAGAEVLAVEAQPRDTWWTIGHDIGHINSEFLKSRGVPEVDPVEFFNTFMVQANGKANPHFVMEFAKNSGKAVDWYLEPVADEVVEKAHVAFWPDNEHTVKNLSNGYRYYTGTAQWWEDNWNGNFINNGEGLEVKNLSWANYDHVEANYPNAVGLFGTKGVQLLKDDSGAVTGFIAKNDKGYIRVNTRRGVVLSGGGFGSNTEMCRDLIPQVARLYTPNEGFMGPMDRDGSTIQMGYWAGGRIEGEIPSQSFDSIAGPDSFSALWLDKDCRRFQNEAFAGPEINGFFMARAKRGVITAIYDSTYEIQMLTGHPGHGSFDYSDERAVNDTKALFEAARSAGAEGANGFYCADTLEELADMLGYDGEKKAQFLASIEEYNAVCAAGVDTDFGKDPRFLFPVTKAPFYAHAAEASIGFALVTNGAFVTTNDYQVVDENYEPIPGLYAAGNTCGMRFGASYITPIPGLSIGMCITLGKLLGDKLAQ